MAMLRFLRQRWMTVLHDLLWVPVAILLAFWVRYNLGAIPVTAWSTIVALSLIAIPVHVISFWVAGCFRGVWRFASIPDLVRFVGAVAVGALATAVIYLAYTPIPDPPRAVLALYPIFLLLGLVGSRIVYRVVLERSALNGGEQSRALVIGAGQAGNLLIRDLMANGPYWPVGILDDSETKLGTDLHGVRVVGTIADLPRLARDMDISAVLVAMPTAERSVLNPIVGDCAELGIQCRMLPSLAELADGRVMVSDLRPITVEDLLGREPVELDSAVVGSFFHGKTVLVTGGGGSIGSELCRQIAERNPALVVVLESSEFNLYRIDQELTERLGEDRVVSRLGDCKHAPTVDRLMRTVQPDIVFHAAAYKHVPLVEGNVIEGVANNVIGTKVVADLAVDHGVGTFVLISTDKTVNPTNYMGASKRVAELYCQSRNRRDGTHFITTRFGNVLASAGSVVPLFEEQIRTGGPVTVTHPDITRYFMTIPEAVSLIMQGAAMGTGGEIFVLDMGEPVRIRDLAEKMVQLSGLQPGRDIEIRYTGLRPGEKLFEELFYASEALGKTSHPKLLLANCMTMDGPALDVVMERLDDALHHADLLQVHEVVKSIVPEFKRVPPDGDTVRKARLKAVQ
jgi:FlaA1/EpsC-like NDP-sugar epimerase